MAENTFKSPGFFEQEIELTAEKQQPTGVPAGIIGAAPMGPAFVPLTLGTFTDFENRFGSLSPDKAAPYAVREWLKNQKSVTFLRVLGAGANTTATDFANTRQFGTVTNAGFKCETASGGGAVQFLMATHAVSGNSDLGFPVFTDNDTWGQTTMREQEDATKSADNINIVRGMLMTTTGSYFVLHNGTNYTGTPNKGKVTDDGDSNTFKIALHNTTSAKTFGNDLGQAYGTRAWTASLDPDHTKYFGKVLNTDPKKFQSEGHLLYLDFPIEHEVAPAVEATDKVFLSFGKDSATSASGTLNSDVTGTVASTWKKLFGRFNTRYRAPKTTSFISQPYGKVEYDLFHFECLSDGSVANSAFKISIANVKKSINPNYEYGTFDVLVRNYADSDFNQEVLERYVGCNLDPNSEDFVAKKIGDKKVVFDFDADLEEERRLVISGRYPNRSLKVRIVMNDNVYKNQVPDSALPFGFRGIPVLDIKNNMDSGDTEWTTCNLPPLPFVFKATKGKVKSTHSTASPMNFVGHEGTNERADSRVYWGVKTTRIEDNTIVSDGVLQANLSGKQSGWAKAYTKFMGIEGGTTKLGHFVSTPDDFNENKFTLARVAFGKSLANATDATYAGIASDYANLGSANVEMKSSAYLRNGDWDPSTYVISDYYANITDRITVAGLVHDKTANNFNKFSKYMKFTNVFYGGFDGLNILDADIEDMNDMASDTSAGKAAETITGGLGLLGSDDGTLMGKGKSNNVVASYRSAIKQMTDPMTVRTKLLAIPDIRDPYVTNFAANKCRDYSMAMYLMDIPNFDESGTRIFKTGVPDIEKTANELEGRSLDNNYAAAYFPDVYITDPINNRRVLAPASVAALGALGYNDNVSYPWFAPAGFNRGGLDFVENVRTRLSVGDRDDLYERRINPIANFPNGGFVIFGQKTLQVNQSALDRVNVRRLLLEVKRQIIEVAHVVLFEQNTPETRARFLGLAQPRLALIQAQAGIEQFRIICDDTNNTPADAEANRLNGKIVLVPTRAVEFIAVDFIITNAGVSFE